MLCINLPRNLNAREIIAKISWYDVQELQLIIIIEEEFFFDDNELNQGSDLPGLPRKMNIMSSEGFNQKG